MPYPINTDHEESHHKTNDFGNKRGHDRGILSQAGMIRDIRHTQFENEQGQDDGKNPITKSFHSIFWHMLASYSVPIFLTPPRGTPSGLFFPLKTLIFFNKIPVNPYHFQRRQLRTRHHRKWYRSLRVTFLQRPVFTIKQIDIIFRSF